jgi:hypothetical protein
MFQRCVTMIEQKLLIRSPAKFTRRAQLRAFRVAREFSRLIPPLRIFTTAILTFGTKVLKSASFIPTIWLKILCCERINLRAF